MRGLHVGFAFRGFGDVLLCGLGAGWLWRLGLFLLPRDLMEVSCCWFQLCFRVCRGKGLLKCTRYEARLPWVRVGSWLKTVVKQCPTD